MSDISKFLNNSLSNDKLLILNISNESERELIYKFIEKNTKSHIIGLYTHIYTTSLKFKLCKCECGEFNVINEKESKFLTICKVCKNDIHHVDKNIINKYNNNLLIIGDYVKIYNEYTYITNGKMDEKQINNILKNKKQFIIDKPDKILDKKSFLKYVNDKLINEN